MLRPLIVGEPNGPVAKSLIGPFQQLSKPYNQADQLLGADDKVTIIPPSVPLLRVPWGKDF